MELSDELLTGKKLIEIIKFYGEDCIIKISDRFVENSDASEMKLYDCAKVGTIEDLGRKCIILLPNLMIIKEHKN